jgi:hypothetical protein
VRRLWAGQWCRPPRFAVAPIWNTLTGGSTINGGAGDDLLTGGSGPDTFVFNLEPGGKPHGGDKITDFSDSDAIKLTGGRDGYYGFGSGNEVRLVSLVYNESTGSWVKAGSITLLGVNETEWLAMTGGEQLDDCDAGFNAWTVTINDDVLAAQVNIDEQLARCERRHLFSLRACLRRGFPR